MSLKFRDLEELYNRLEEEDRERNSELFEEREEKANHVLRKQLEGSYTPTEHEEQVLLFRWAHENEHRYPVLPLLHAIPNGGHRLKAVAGKLRAEGVKAGIPDVHLPVARNGFHSLYIEMKRTKGGRLTLDQNEMIARLRLANNQVEVCKGWEEARDVLVQYLGGSLALDT